MGEDRQLVFGAGTMDPMTMIFFSATTSFIFLCVGIIAGWTAKDFMHDYFWTQDEHAAFHPEMYDDNGVMFNEELLTVKFIEEEPDETIDE